MILLFYQIYNAPRWDLIAAEAESFLTLQGNMKGEKSKGGTTGITTGASKMVLLFHSDDKTEADGFSVTYKAIGKLE